MDLEFTCTKHNFNFGFDRPADGTEPATLLCPLCAKERLDGWVKQAKELREHRDLLLRAIDLKQLVQPVPPNDALTGDGPQARRPG